jgi:hypothetical protein
MNHFFITGLTRSRTAWLANLMTNGVSFCHHGLSKGFDTTSEMIAFLASPTGYHHLGNSEPGISFEMFKEIDTAFPDARWVVIHRGVTDAYVAQSKAFPQLSKLMTESAMMHAQYDLQRIEQALGPRCLSVSFDHLDDFHQCKVIAEHLAPYFTLTFDRWKLLHKLRVETIGEKAVREWSPNKAQFVKEVACLS